MENEARPVAKISPPINRVQENNSFSATCLVVPISRLFLSSLAGFSPRGICFSDFLRSLLQLLLQIRPADKIYATSISRGRCAAADRAAVKIRDSGVGQGPHPPRRAERRQTWPRESWATIPPQKTRVAHICLPLANVGLSSTHPTVLCRRVTTTCQFLKNATVQASRFQHLEL